MTSDTRFFPEGLATIGARLQACRQSARMTQQQVADAIEEASGQKLTRAAYAQWEINLTKPDVDRIRFAAKVFDVSPAYLAFGEPDARLDDIVWIEELADQPGERWALPRGELERLKVDESGLRMLRSPSDEDELGVRLGDPILIDTGVRAVTRPGAYIFLNAGRFELAGMALKPSPKGDFVALRSGPVNYEVKAADLDVRGRVLAGWARF